MDNTQPLVFQVYECFFELYHIRMHNTAEQLHLFKSNLNIIPGLNLIPRKQKSFSAYLLSDVFGHPVEIYFFHCINLVVESSYNFVNATEGPSAYSLF